MPLIFELTQIMVINVQQKFEVCRMSNNGIREIISSTQKLLTERITCVIGQVGHSMFEEMRSLKNANPKECQSKYCALKFISGNIEL